MIWQRKLNLIKVCIVCNLRNKKLNYSVIEYNDVARTLKKLRKSKGDYCIKQ